MKAIVVEELGGAEKLIPKEVPGLDAPGPGELLVDVAAAGVNFVDVYHRRGLYDMDLPFTPGMEGAGTVVAVGAGVDGIEPGDRVGWANVLGSYAERHLVQADRAVRVPDGVELRLAAAVLLQGLTAHYLATDTWPLQPGDRCLIHAGAGGVGLLLTQIAKRRGAEVFTTVGTADKARLSREAGADHVIVYTEEDFQTAIEEVAGPKPLDVVYDGVGADTFMKGLDLLRPRGLMATFGNASGPVPEISPLLLSQKGSLFLTRPTMAHYLLTRDELLGRSADLFSWMEAGELDVRVGQELPLDRAADAHRALEARETTGKVLLIP
ncbi:MAG TPA: quinone oxidoreductase [Acidimicrobiia bacterium]|nr:quinone oxidoreductase [Acidimicrobiia bacterium]